MRREERSRGRCGCCPEGGGAQKGFKRIPFWFLSFASLGGEAGTPCQETGHGGWRSGGHNYVDLYRHAQLSNAVNLVTSVKEIARKSADREEGKQPICGGYVLLQLRWLGPVPALRHELDALEKRGLALATRSPTNSRLPFVRSQIVHWQQSIAACWTAKRMRGCFGPTQITLCLPPLLSSPVVARRLDAARADLSPASKKRLAEVGVAACSVCTTSCS